MATMFISSYFGTSPLLSATNTKVCTLLPTPHWYYVYHMTLISGAGCVSVAIYIGIFFAYRHNNHVTALARARTNQPHFTISLAKLAIQRRLTVTLGIITVSTLIFFIIPYTILAVTLWIGKDPPQPTVLSVVSKFSTIINVLIYLYRQKEVRSVGYWWSQEEYDGD
jgi:hypothetical protein